MFKATLRIPCAEPYAYIEIAKEFESNEDVISEYNNVTKYVSGGSGLSDKEFNTVLDNYLTTGEFDPDLSPSLSKEQMGIIQAIKRSSARIRAHQNEAY